MKRLTKTKLIILLITITFLCGINKVGAITCQYKLPFSGINASTGNYIKFDSDFKCSESDAKAKNCSVNATISTKLYSFDSCEDGAGVSNDEIYIKTFNYYRLWGSDSGGTLLYNGDFEGTYSVNDAKLNSESCPKYITIYPGLNSSDTSKKFLKALMKEAYGAADGKCGMARNDPYFYITGWEKYFGTKNPNYSVKNDYISRQYNTFPGSDIKYLDSKYEEFLKNSYNASKASELDNMDEIILPLYNGDTDTDHATARETTDIYRDVVGTAWSNLLNKHKENLKNSCGDKWESYINLKNYENDFSKYKSQSLIDYATGSYDSSSLLKNDSGMSEACWNTRSEFMEMFKTFRIFMYNIGVTTKGQTVNNDNIYFQAFYDDTTKDIDNNKVYDWITMNYFFTAVRWGTDQKLETYTSDNEQVNGKLEDIENVKASDYIKNTLYKDRCAYICFDNHTINDLNTAKGIYSSCSNIPKYNTCKSALSSCNGKYNCLNQVSSALTACESSYNNLITSPSFKKCMEEDHGITNFINDYNAASKLAQEKYDSAYKAYTTERRTFPVIIADLPELNYEFTKYTPKCSDVSIFTDIWQAMRIIAPFLLIIFGSLDYFKAVIANDMEAMKKAKSKFPKRLIAFLLLILVPTIISIIMKAGTNGAENTSYFKCIVTGDKGDDN